MKTVGSVIIISLVIIRYEVKNLTILLFRCQQVCKMFQ